MFLALFYCFIIILLVYLLFSFTSVRIEAKKPNFVHKFQLEMVKTHLEQTYKLNTYQDYLHKQ